MNFKEVKQKIKTFINDELISLEPWIVNSEWSEKLPKLNELRDKVKEMGFWLPQVSKEYGGLGLTLEQHGEVSEILGASPYGFYVFNCQAPDAGNMEVLIETGTKEQKEKYLKPLLEGKIRSCFAMTEPNYAGSNPTRMGTTAKKENGNISNKFNSICFQWNNDLTSFFMNILSVWISYRHNYCKICSVKT